MGIWFFAEIWYVRYSSFRASRSDLSTIFTVECENAITMVIGAQFASETKNAVLSHHTLGWLPFFDFAQKHLAKQV